MIKMSRLAGLVAVAAAVTVLASACSIYKPRHDIRQLVITGNYQEPRLMADLVQVESSQPYVLVPNSLDQRIFYVPGNNGKPYEIPPADFSRAIAVMNPDQIVILGDARYVPAQYEEALAGLPVMRLYSNSWTTTAERLQSVLKLNNLAYDFRKSMETIRTRRTLDNPAGIRMGDAQPYSTRISEPAVPPPPPSTRTVIEDVEIISEPLGDAPVTVEPELKLK